MNAYLYYSMLLTGFVYPVVAHNIWSSNGILTHKRRDPLLGVGVIDFAGSGVVHLTGGYTALIATWLLGPRKGRFFDQRGNKLPHPKPFPGHSKSLQMLGTFILWFGWYGFNAGSAIELGAEIRPAVIARTVVNTTLAGASSGIVSLFANLIAHERKTGEAIFKLSSLMNGCLAGLAAITGSCGVIEPWAAIVIGAIAGLLFWWSSNVLVKYCIDDAVDAIPVHLSGGIWGLIATGLFASPKALSQYFGDEYSGHAGWFYSLGHGSGDAALLACQIIALLFIVAWVSVIMFPFFLILKYLGIFRSDGLEELVGLDASYHDWTPIQVKDEVSNKHIREYMKQNNRKYYSSDSERSRTKSSEEADGDQDDGGVDRIEA
jgi:Amt family ammonium transporter